MPKHEAWELKSMQAAPLQTKIQLTMARVREWIDEFGEDGVYISFSGGKDSTVLLHIIRQEFPDIPAVFANTGLEYPSLVRFALSHDNVTEVRPEMPFAKVIEKYGYPIVSKEVAEAVEKARSSGNTRKLDGSMVGVPFDMSTYKWLLDAPFKISAKCCDISKKSPMITYATKTGRKPIVATMACESRLRRQKWIMHGCNAFDTEHPQSNPMAFWLEQDVLAYIHKNHLPIAPPYRGIVIDNNKTEQHGQLSIYDITGNYEGCRFRTTGCVRTGCVYCLFGIRSDWDRLVRLQEEEPEICDYVMRGGEFKDGMWKPKNGFGFRFVCEWLNENGGFKIRLPE